MSALSETRVATRAHTDLGFAVTYKKGNGLSSAHRVMKALGVFVKDLPRNLSALMRDDMSYWRSISVNSTLTASLQVLV